MRKEIILVGPMCAGKSTIAKHLSRNLKIPHIDLDKIKINYFEKLGFNTKDAEIAYSNGGIKELFFYYKKFEFNALIQILSDYKDCIFDLGAGFAIYEDEDEKIKFQEIIKSFENKFLILPNQNIFETHNILEYRIRERFIIDPELSNILTSTPGFNLNIYLTEHFYKNLDLYKIIYTYSKGIKNITNEIIKFLDY